MSNVDLQLEFASLNLNIVLNIHKYWERGWGGLLWIHQKYAENDTGNDLVFTGLSVNTTFDICLRNSQKPVRTGPSWFV